MTKYKFSLDELHLLREGMDVLNMLGGQDSNAVNVRKMRDKLNTIIQYYCDHDWVNTYSEIEVWKCKKCHQRDDLVFGEEEQT